MLIAGEGIGLYWFAQMRRASRSLSVAMLNFGLFTHMACGATYALVRSRPQSASAGVAGVIGAGGNVGAENGGGLPDEGPRRRAADTLSMLGLLVAVLGAARWRCASARSTRRTRGGAARPRARQGINNSIAS